LKLEITIENLSSGDVKEFEIENLETSTGEISFTVNDWENIDNEEKKTVTITKDDEQIDVSDGTSGEEIDKIIDDRQNGGGTNRWIWVLISILSMIILGFGYQLTGIMENGKVLVDSVNVRPDFPIYGEPAFITVIIKNKGKTIENEKYTIIVSFTDENWLVGEMPIGLSDDSFKKGKTREVVMEWKPFFAGKHSLQVNVKVNQKITDKKSKIVHFSEEKPIEISSINEPKEMIVIDEPIEMIVIDEPYEYEEVTDHS